MGGCTSTNVLRPRTESSKGHYTKVESFSISQPVKLDIISLPAEFAPPMLGGIQNISEDLDFHLPGCVHVKGGDDDIAKLGKSKILEDEVTAMPNKSNLVEERPGKAKRNSVFERGFHRYADRLKSLTRVDLEANPSLDIQNYVPRIIHEAVALGRAGHDSSEHVIFKGEGAVSFLDASGFTALTETLSKKPFGAEILTKILNQFFEPLLDACATYGGDVVKFSGDAVTVLWSKHDLAHSCALACQCALAIQIDLEALDFSKEDLDGHALSLHGGIGCGDVVMLEVGGVLGRREFVLAGSPLVQIAVAEPLAGKGETVISPEVWEKLTGAEGKPCASPHEQLRVLERLRNKLEPPSSLTPLHSDISIIGRFIPAMILLKLEGGQTEYLNEMREVSVCFVQVRDIDPAAFSTSNVQSLVLGMQRVVYQYEGSVNKLLVDDKGLLLLCAWGLLPMAHPDDAERAVVAANELSQTMQFEGLLGAVGVASGMVWVGVIGAPHGRKEYTIIGDAVNVAARLMSVARPHGVLVDSETVWRAERSIKFQAMPPLKLKGKAGLTAVFEPVLTLEQRRQGPDDWIPLWPAKPASSILQHAQFRTLMQNAGLARGSYLHFGAELPKGSQSHGDEPNMLNVFHNGGVVMISGLEGAGVRYAGRLFAEVAAQHMGRPRCIIADVRTLQQQWILVESAILAAVENVTLAKNSLAINIVPSLSRLAGLIHDWSTGCNSPCIVHAGVCKCTSLFNTGKDDVALWTQLRNFGDYCLSRRHSARAALVLLISYSRVPRSLVVGREASVQCSDYFASQSCMHVELGPLSEDEIHGFVTLCLGGGQPGAVPRSLAKSIHVHTGGIPLFVAEAVNEVERLVLKNAEFSKPLPVILEHLPVADWHWTHMVGSAEAALDGLPASNILAMVVASVFKSTFGIIELASSWACSEQKRFEYGQCLRLFLICISLISKGMLKFAHSSDPASGRVVRFCFATPLQQAVANRRILMSQRKRILMGRLRASFLVAVASIA